MEKTFVMIKPDGVRRGLMGDIISRIEKKGFKITKAKLVEPGRKMFEKHYIEHIEKPFFEELLTYILTGPVMAMEVEGNYVIEIMRLMIGNRDPKLAAPGTIRGDYASSINENVIHASDSPSSAKRELELWFD
ncbi:MAG: nucleoside-diphosphate kinase [Clostridiales bacterium]|nr:nucleoside-diphosphate kinase [Clostridiales bacterium]